MRIETNALAFLALDSVVLTALLFRAWTSGWDVGRISVRLGLVDVFFLNFNFPNQIHQLTQVLSSQSPSLTSSPTL